MTEALTKAASSAGRVAGISRAPRRVGDAARVGDHDATRFLAIELARVAHDHRAEPERHLCVALSRFAGPAGTENPAELGELEGVFDAVLEAITPNTIQR